MLEKIWPLSIVYPMGALQKNLLPNWKPFGISDFTASAALPKARRTICTPSLPDALHLRQIRKSLNLGETFMTPAVKILENSGVPFMIHRYPHDPKNEAYAMEAAEALGISPHRLFKTLVILLNGCKEAVALVPASKRLDLKAVAETMGAKSATMASPEVAQRAASYVIGGISPLGHRKPMPVVVEEAALDHKTLYVSAGKRGFQVELGPKDLIRLCKATLGKISK